MAFSCRECLDRIEEQGHFDNCPFGGFGMMTSRGRCEDCHQTKVCIDCKCYRFKRRPASTDHTEGTP